MESFEEISQQDSENAEGSNLDKCAKKSNKVILAHRELSRDDVSNRGRRRNTAGHCVTQRAMYTSKKGGQCAGDERGLMYRASDYLFTSCNSRSASQEV
jgi:hypothetical protein